MKKKDKALELTTTPIERSAIGLLILSGDTFFLSSVLSVEQVTVFHQLLGTNGSWSRGHIQCQW